MHKERALCQLIVFCLERNYVTWLLINIQWTAQLKEFSIIFSTRTSYDTRLALQFHHMEKLLQKTAVHRRKTGTAEEIPETAAG